MELILEDELLLEVITVGAVAGNEFDVTDAVDAVDEDTDVVSDEVEVNGELLVTGGNVTDVGVMIGPPLIVPKHIGVPAEVVQIG